jgi:hypothetical protein
MSIKLERRRVKVAASWVDVGVRRMGFHIRSVVVVN